jgi:hypothetical protein
MYWSHKGFSHGKNDGIKSHIVVPLKQFACGWVASAGSIIGLKGKSGDFWSKIHCRLCGL